MTQTPDTKPYGTSRIEYSYDKPGILEQQGADMTRKEMLYHDLTYDPDPALHCSADMREWLTKFSGKLARAGPATTTAGTETQTKKEPT